MVSIDINEELWIRSRTSISSDTSSSSLSSSPIARQGGKLLQVVKSKVNFSRGSKKATQTDRVSVHDAEDSSRSRNSRTQDGEIVSDKLMEELETLRRKLEKKEKEMQKLNNEVWKSYRQLNVTVIKAPPYLVTSLGFKCSKVVSEKKSFTVSLS